MIYDTLIRFRPSFDRRLSARTIKQSQIVDAGLGQKTQNTPTHSSSIGACVMTRCCYLGFDVFGGQTLSNDVDALAVAQDVGSALGVVHQRFNAADQRRVNLRLGALVVH